MSDIEFVLKPLGLRASSYFYDAEIDGKSIGSIIEEEYRLYSDDDVPGGIFDLGFTVSMLSPTVLRDENRMKHIKIELNKPFASQIDAIINSGQLRVPIFSCSECRDVGCGKISALLSSNERVTWTDFAYQETEDKLEDQKVLASLRFEFDKKSYVDKLNDLRNLIINEIKNVP